jgi:hypothetical protein
MKNTKRHDTSNHTDAAGRPRRRLSLHRDTVAMLTAKELKGVVGGMRGGTWGRPPDTCADQHCG